MKERYKDFLKECGIKDPANWNVILIGEDFKLTMRSSKAIKNEDHIILDPATKVLFVTDCHVEQGSFGLWLIDGKPLLINHMCMLDGVLLDKYNNLVYLEEQAYFNGDWDEQYGGLADEWDAAVASHFNINKN